MEAGKDQAEQLQQVKWGNGKHTAAHTAPLAPPLRADPGIMGPSHGSRGRELCGHAHGGQLGGKGRQEISGGALSSFFSLLLSSF